MLSPTPTPLPGRPGVTRPLRNRHVRRLRAPQAAARDRMKALPHELPLILPAPQQAWRELPPNELPARHRPGGPLLAGPPTVGTTPPTRPTNPPRARRISPKLEGSLAPLAPAWP